ncbi:MAG: (P)ppGpp synthetase I, SpoT/RelA [Candidatus Woesebacteria bacterium GW2011_GWC2_45_9]|uniref:(P)ppGpp synthetase I, SpoT/RelA n=1 Tax=Candidatus Woesebacteria bacterium GW2011_GWC2_45_9 TaxID=1618589 RepID=A0A0G1QIT7_9BACT|nr:MAG: (P)ppGpp synthetase I, SpoT/RelA [Candidatus Woesebacteria bacterium GW2011_GWC2_45_9]
MTKIELEKKFSELLEEIRGYNGEADFPLIKRAWAFAKLAHTGQKRLTGEPFVAHPLEVAKRLAVWRLDTTSIMAALLHDTIEDGGAKREDIVSEFGEAVASLVDGVTKVTTLRLKGSREKEFVENLRKMLLVMAQDLRVILVKLADRLHNMQTLYSLSPQKQRENSEETLDIYAPLAERLGMGRVKGELEDLAFPYVFPEEYKKIFKESKPFYKEAEEHIEKMRRALLKELISEGIKAEIHGRKKHLYSLWRKLARPEIDEDFDKVHDIVALRIIVGTVAQCYTALGKVHSLYKPVPHIGISDFIAQPKPNGYRCLHTKVFGPGGRIVEVQIRTHLMHEQAEFGVAAHWAYEELKAAGEKDEVLEKEGAVAPKKLSWVRQLIEWQNELSDSEEFLRAVKFDALKHRNFVFSPMGDVFDLPVEATPIDFAYAVHTDLVNFIKGAKVDGRIVSLDYKLKSGQVVEILKSKTPKKPNKDWLDFVVTTTARSKIKKAL